MRFGRIIFLAGLLPLVAGCGVMFGGTRQVIDVTSSPEAAEVTAVPPIGRYTTPTAISLERKSEYVLTVSSPGYTSREVRLQRSLRGGILVLDILAGLVGVIVDATTGAWYRLSPDSVDVSLVKVAAVPGPETIHLAVRTTGTRKGAGVRVESSVPGVEVRVRER